MRACEASDSVEHEVRHTVSVSEPARAKREVSEIINDKNVQNNSLFIILSILYHNILCKLAKQARVWSTKCDTLTVSKLIQAWQEAKGAAI